MKVLDACVVTDALAVTGPVGDRARRLVADQPRLHTPAILTAEVTSALRAMVLGGRLGADAASEAARRAVRLRARRYPFEPFLQRSWELRASVTTYDGWYVALAEALGASLITSDERLRNAPGPRCPVLSPEQALAQG